jgi:hypothetical protein
MAVLGTECVGHFLRRWSSVHPLVSGNHRRTLFDRGAVILFGRSRRGLRRVVFDSQLSAGGRDAELFLARGPEGSPVSWRFGFRISLVLSATRSFHWATQWTVNVRHSL